MVYRKANWVFTTYTLNFSKRKVWGCQHDCLQREVILNSHLGFIVTNFKRTQLLFNNQTDWAVKMNVILGKLKFSLSNKSRHLWEFEGRNSSSLAKRQSPPCLHPGFICKQAKLHPPNPTDHYWITKGYHCRISVFFLPMPQTQYLVSKSWGD